MASQYGGTNDEEQELLLRDLEASTARIVKKSGVLHEEGNKYTFLILY